jgi:hypothetical protein
MVRFVLLLVLFLQAPRALAAVALPVTVEGLAGASDAVVRGRVDRVVARRSSDGRLIVTYAEIVTASAWRGSPPARVTVVTPGGVVGDLGQRVDGMATFHVGEEVVVFVARAGAGTWRVAGAAQGKFRVEGGQATPDLTGTTFVERRSALGERRSGRMAVDELERRVRAAP